MSEYFNYNDDVDTIEIKQDDLDSPEKVEKFISLFGRSNYYKAYHTLAEQRFGDGAKEKIENLMATKDLDNPKELREYEQLRSKWEKESERLKSKEKASVRIPVYENTKERVFNNREMAKEYLQGRYHTAAGFGNGLEAATDRGLRKNNQKINEVERKHDEIQKQLNALENKRKELLKQQGS